MTFMASGFLYERSKYRAIDMFPF